jgi:hypothetical protein
MRSYPYCNRQERHGLRCDEATLALVRSVRDESAPGVQAEEAIYRCAVCGGLYKHLRVWEYTQRCFDVDEGWWMAEDRFYPVGELVSGGVPFPIEEARTYGYAGEDFTLLNGRCDYPRQLNGLTCRFSQLALVARPEGECPAEIRRCRRCGQFYKQIRERGGYRFYRPGEEDGGAVVFPLAEALAHGYQPWTKPPGAP